MNSPAQQASTQRPQQQAEHQRQPAHSHSYHSVNGPLDPRLGAPTTTPSAPAPAGNNRDSPSQNTAPSSTHLPLAPFLAPTPYADHTAHRSTASNYTTHTNAPKTEVAGSNAYASPQPYYQYPQSNPGGTPHTRPAPGPTAISNRASPDSYPNHTEPGSPDHVDGQALDDAKRPRACEACRGLKVRCDQDPAHPEIPCKRCAKANRQCVITQPSRKRQKKADSRVAELEKKLDALTAVLQQQQALPPGNIAYAPLSAGSASQPSPASAVSGTQLPPLQTYGHSQPGSLPSLARTTSDHNNAHEPTRKRRRTGDEAPETPTLDGAGVEVARMRLPPSPRSSRDAMAEQYRLQHDPWGPNADIKRYLDRSPQELCNRVHSLIPHGMEVTIFNRFVTSFAPYLPVIVFPPNITADQMRRDKPILYTCIISAAAFGMLPPDASKQISMEAVGAIADSVVRNGNKSLELVQALHVLALWYRPPERAEQTNFYQIIHMAAAMALDIGLGTRFNANKARRGFGGPNQHFTPNYKMLPQDSDALDARRAWLGCYYLCASSSMVLRRPNMVRWSNYMTECIEVLESSPDALPSDKLLCQHIKISHICEEIGLQFLMDDNTASVSIQDPKVAYQLNVLEGQLKSWKDKIPPECRIPSLQFFEHVTNLYLHEIALHMNHNVDDFKLPFTEESLKSVNSSSDALSQHQMAALEACQKAAHGILDTMLSFDIQVVQALPMLIFVVRCIYAVVILVKMHVAINTPGSELAKFMKAEDLRVEYYLEKLLDIYRIVAKDDSFVADTKIVRILSLLRDWYLKHRANIEAQARGEPLPYPPNPSPVEQQTKSEPAAQNSSLHLLSQVATGNPASSRQNPAPPSASSATTGPQDWTFTTPFVLDYASYEKPRPSPSSRVSLFSSQSTPPSSSSTPYQQQRQQQQGGGGGGGNAYSTAATGFDSGGGSGGGIIDSADFGWGSGFEQAMDIAMGGVDGLAGNGLDPWFLGDAMAPFGFSGDAAAAVGASGGGGGAGQW